MPNIIKLTPEDQDLLMNQIAENYCYKTDRKLRRRESKQRMSEYYIDAIEKIDQNYIEVRHPKNNFFVWLEDQLAHSHKSQYDSPDCQRAREICRAASQGRYDDLVKQRLWRCQP